MKEVNQLDGVSDNRSANGRSVDEDGRMLQIREDQVNREGQPADAGHEGRDEARQEEGDGHDGLDRSVLRCLDDVRDQMGVLGAPVDEERDDAHDDDGAGPLQQTHQQQREADKRRDSHEEWL
ncbi:hypothetical protein LOZ58_001584 [Ophidiomyces ophidiicola]|nr:hypothetical protein LOZ58_001584 [Ophidiomyces ophidiicola]